MTTPEKRPVRVGIDFGTTHTIVALADGGNHPILSLPFEYGGDTIITDCIPSCVTCYEGRLLYGAAARACYLNHVDDGAVTLRSIKRHLQDWHEGRTVRIGDIEVAVDALLTEFLGTGRRAIRRALDVEGTPEIEAVISVPANASSSQRYVTLRCFRAAGFRVGRILDEPCASAIQFVHERYKRWDRVTADVIIYDLGGGTFDTTFLSVAEGTYDPRLTRGISRLGGDDFDERLLALVETEAGTTFVGAERIRMLELVREAKESLGAQSRNLHVDTDEGVVTVALADFEAAVAPLVRQTIDLVDDVLTGAAGAGAAPDRVVLVGGGSLLRLVPKALADRFGRAKIHKGLYPLASVAIGAAIQAASPDLTVRDRLTNHFGVVRVTASGDEYVDVIFPKGHELPAPGQVHRQARPPYDPRHDIGLYRYLECDAIDETSGSPVGAPTHWGEVRFPYAAWLSPRDVTCNAPTRRDDLRHERVVETYELDEYGIVTVRLARTVQDDFTNCYSLYKRMP